MSPEEIYGELIRVSDQQFISKPMIVGGIPRDIYLGINSNRDVDITTNDSDCPRLGLTLASELNFGFKMFEDAHVSVYTESGSLDFSGNFISKKAVEYLESNYKMQDKLLYETCSRDFTINTLHKDLMGERIYDPLDVAERDLGGKIIRTITTPDICFGDDIRRIFRSINFAARFNFAIDGTIIDYARSNIDLISREMGRTLRDAFVTSIISESIEKNPDITLGYIGDMNILGLIPLTGRFKEELISRKMIIDYLDSSTNSKNNMMDT